MGKTLTADARTLPAGDPAGPGPMAVSARGTRIGDFGDGFPVALYSPEGARGPLPSIVFLPGRVAPEGQYESYARALASRGFVVAVRGWYSPFVTDKELAKDAVTMADWLVKEGLADPAHLGVAGHSMGAKDAILAASRDRRFKAVVALDPDDNGKVSVARGVIKTLPAALLLVGAEVSWKASSVCAPKEHNYQRFYEQAPPGTVELTLRDADHVQVMDDPNQLGMGICRCGGADSHLVRTLARGATVSFFSEHLLGSKPMTVAWGTGAAVRVKERPTMEAVREPVKGERLVTARQN